MNEVGVRFIALDLEATGGGDDDEIIEIAALKCQGEEIVDRFHSLVRPRRPLSARVQALTGLRNSALQTAPSFAEVLPALDSFLEDLPLVAHSVELDRRRLQRGGLTAANLAFDTHELAGVLLPGLPAYNLVAVAGALGLEAPEAHRAEPDAALTRTVFLGLLERAATLDPRLLLQISLLLANSEWSLRLVFQEAERLGRRTALERPIAGTGMTVDPEGLPTRRASDAPPLEPAHATRPLDLDALRATWSPDGPLARGFPAYERRPQQQEMSEAVAAAFNAGGRLLAEGGTGTGKTLAYLIPAAQWALKNGERVVISTNTVNLQDQILSKDIPDLQRALGVRFAAHVLKGRGNYLCLLRWADFRNRRPDAPLTALESRMMVKVLLWLGRAGSGDVADLNLVGEEQRLWAEIAATQETCTNESCRFKQRRTCFFFNARRAAEAAHLVIVNHALLLSDLAADNGVLPDYAHLILDEAHHLEDQATAHLGFDLSRRDVFALLDELYARGDPQRPRGLTQDFQRLLPRAEAAGARAIEALRQTADQVERARAVAARFFGALGAFSSALVEDGPLRGERNGPYERHTRITGALRDHRRWPAAVTAWKDLAVILAEVQASLDTVSQALASLPDGGHEDWERQTLLLNSLASRLSEMRAQLHALFLEPDANGVYWLSQGDGAEATSLHAAPLNVGELLNTKLFAPRHTVVLTSATLTVNDRFDYLRSRIGLGDAAEVRIGSPFDYPRQALLLAPEDIADPLAPAYASQVHESLVAFASAAGGRCLVLFTSHAALRAAYRAIKGPLEELGITVVAQNLDGSRNHLVQLLRGRHKTVILGSSSFWEGVDVAGEALSALAIVKLPFTTPTDPVFAARCEQFARPFDEYAVPQAVLRFKQGFGRLIRTATDRGVLLVLDKRLTSKYYGRQFARSIPPVTMRRVPLTKVKSETETWLAPPG